MTYFLVQSGTTYYLIQHQGGPSGPAYLLATFFNPDAYKIEQLKLLVTNANKGATTQ